MSERVGAHYVPKAPEIAETAGAAVQTGGTNEIHTLILGQAITGLAAFS